MRGSDVNDGRALDPRVLIATVFTIAFGLRVLLIGAHPTIHGGDATARLAHADTLVLGYQLPLPQAIVMAGKAISDDPRVARILVASAGGLLASGLAALSLGLSSLRAAAIVGALSAFDPLLLHYSVVPYQESVAYGLLAWSGALALVSRPRLAATCLAAACLSRYEAWLFIPVVLPLLRSWSSRFIACAAPALWMAWWGGLQPEGLYVLDIDTAAPRGSRLAYLASKFLEYESAALATLALGGALIAIAQRRLGVLTVLATTLVASGIAVFFGHEFPPGTGLVSERLIHLPVLLCLILAAHAMASIAAFGRPLAFLATAATIAICARGGLLEMRLLDEAARLPDLALARMTAEILDERRGPGECVQVRSPAVDPRDLDAYVRKVEAVGGNGARARERAAQLMNESPDRDRIAAHLRAPPRTVRSGEGCPWVVTIDGLGDPAGATHVAFISAGSRSARIVRIR